MEWTGEWMARKALRTSTSTSSIGAYMAFTVFRPYALQRVILPFGTERGVVRHEL